MRRSRVWGAGWLAFGLIASACSTSPEPADTTFRIAVDTLTTDPATSSTEVSSTTAAPATSAAPTTTEAPVIDDRLLPDPIDDASVLTDPDAPPPRVDLKADTWAELVGVWSDIDAYWTWLYSHPTADQAALSTIFFGGGPELEQQASTLQMLIEEGLRIVSPGFIGTPIGFGCCPDPEGEMALGVITLLIQTRLDGQAFFADSDGSQVESIDGWASSDWRVELRRTGEGDWKVWTLEAA